MFVCDARSDFDIRAIAATQICRACSISVFLVSGECSKRLRRMLTVLSTRFRRKDMVGGFQWNKSVNAHRYMCVFIVSNVRD